MAKYVAWYSTWESPGWFDVVAEVESEPDPKSIVAAIREHLGPPGFRGVEVREVTNSWTGEELLKMEASDVIDDDPTKPDEGAHRIILEKKGVQDES